MDKDGWYKIINMFTNLAGAYTGNIHFFSTVMTHTGIQTLSI